MNSNIQQKLKNKSPAILSPMDHYNHKEDSKNSSSDENDLQFEKTDVTLSSSRLYECVFCKRGFTTAQALGGHMNIHRKGRIKTRPESLRSNPSNPEGNYSSLGSNPQVFQSSTSNPFMDSKVYADYQEHNVQASASGLRYSSLHKNDNLRGSNSIRDVGSFDRKKKETQKKDQGSSEKDELDLELRL